MRVLTVKCPDPVQHVVGRGGNRETDCICHIFLYFNYLLKEIGTPEIHEDARKPNHAEFDELQKENLVDQLIEIHKERNNISE